MGDMETRPAPLPARRREEMPLTVISEGDVLVGRLAMSGNGQGLAASVGKSVPPVFFLGLICVNLVG